ncbi:MAG: glycosyltransferase [Candidatus Eremiobacteraeota bacterium]|nr:glycosyltransferase [Candidatus Eremiobacteraeota bacterium]
MKEVYLSVVIPTYNRLSTLKIVLDWFGFQTLVLDQFEVIVVDSSSTDGTEEFMQQLKPNYCLRYIRQENKGRPGARNRGVQEASGEIVVFSDSDIIPEKNFLEKHFLFHQNNRNAAAVGWESRINSLDELEEARRSPDKRFRIHKPAGKKLSWLYFLTGNASVSKRKLMEVGLFDETFQGYGFEDLELGYRLWKSGVKIMYLPEALNYHLHPRTLENQYEVQKMAGKNAVYFYRKHKDWRIRWLLGMSPPAFFWYSLLRKLPFLLHYFEEKAESRSTFFREVMVQYHYLLGVKEAWKK